MTANDGVSIALIISITSIICTVYTTVVNGRKRQHELIEADKNRQLEIEKQFVKINVKLDDFCEQMRDMVKKYDKSTDELRHMSERLIMDNERLNDHEKRIAELEKDR